MSVYVYVEGGGEGGALKKACREGFSKFLRKAGLAGNMPRIVAFGSRYNAFNYFNTAVATGKDTVLLLVDAEGPVVAPVANARPWQHLKDRDDWNRPNQASDDQCHLMVQVMEAWFLADTTALKSYFRQGFREGALPQNSNVEEVPKRDIETKLKLATRATSKGEYSKGKHSFEILAELDPARVRHKSPYAERFLSTLQQLCEE